MKSLFIHIIYSLSSIVFPSPSEIQELESLSTEDFVLKASPLSTEPDDNIKSLFNYHDPLIKKSLWELKYQGNTKIAQTLGKLLYERLLDELSDALMFSNFDKPILIPLPLSKKRRKVRGWNQSEILIRAIVTYDIHKIFSYSFTTLIKHQHTEPQTKLTRSERMQNLKGCFMVQNKEFIKHKNIILIDDVTTTGSTIREAMSVLKEAGAGKIMAFTIAH